MRFLYGLSDEKLILYRTERRGKGGPFSNPCYKEHSSVLKGIDKWERDEPSLVFRATPDTLLQLCLNAIDKFTLPMPFKWSTDDVCRWIHRYGYPHFKHTFRKNMINGRTLLLVDASALSAMNIKAFCDIKHIAYGIRQLFFYEMALFARSITLPQNELMDLFKLFRVKTGFKYEEPKRSHYWRFMKFVRERAPNRNHWQILERWLAFIPEKENDEFFGGIHRGNLYKCSRKQTVEEPEKKSPFKKVFDYENAPSIYEVVKRGYNKCQHITLDQLKQSVDCTCHDLPCECGWQQANYQPPRRLTCLRKQQITVRDDCVCKEVCQVHALGKPAKAGAAVKCECWPPCDCHWKQHEYKHGYTLTALKDGMPYKYCHNYYARRNPDFSMMNGPLNFFESEDDGANMSWE